MDIISKLHCPHVKNWTAQTTLTCFVGVRVIIVYLIRQVCFSLLQFCSLSSTCYRHIGSYTCSSDWQRNRGVPYRTNCTLLSSCAVALTARNSRGVVKSTSCRFTVPLSVCCLFITILLTLKFPTIFQSKSKC
jgi:hypothetical protein